MAWPAFYFGRLVQLLTFTFSWLFNTCIHHYYLFKHVGFFKAFPMASRYLSRYLSRWGV